MTVPSLMGGQKPGPQKDISFKRDLTDLCAFPPPSLVVCPYGQGGSPLAPQKPKATS